MDECACTLLKNELGFQFLKPIEQPEGGFISQCFVCKTDKGKIFIKTFEGENGKMMFEKEVICLSALRKIRAVYVPKTLKVISKDNNSWLAMEYMKLKELKKMQSEFGRQLAQLHLHNMQLLNRGNPEAISKFGFQISTYCGRILLDNTWNDDWVDFFCNQRIDPQVSAIAQKEGINEQIPHLWSQLKPHVHKLFSNITIQPSLLHGDLWIGNVGELNHTCSHV